MKRTTEEKTSIKHRKRRLPAVCFVLLFLLLFAFFYNPFDASALFRTTPDEAVVASYISSLSEQWDNLMDNREIMAAASRISGNDLSELRSNTGVKWTLRLLTGKRSVLSVVRDDGGQDSDGLGYYLAGSTHVGSRYLIMKFLKAIKYVPGLGKMGVTANGTRYFDFSSDKCGVDGRNWLLGLDLKDGMLVATFSTDPDTVSCLTARLETGAASQPWFGEDPWRFVRKSGFSDGFVFFEASGNFAGALTGAPKSGAEFNARAFVNTGILPGNFAAAEPISRFGFPGDSVFRDFSADSTAFFAVCSPSITPWKNAEAGGICAGAVFRTCGGLLPPFLLSVPAPEKSLQEIAGEFLPAGSGNVLKLRRTKDAISLDFDFAPILGFRSSELLRAEQHGATLTISSGTNLLTSVSDGGTSIAEMFGRRTKGCTGQLLAGFADLSSVSEILRKLSAGTGVLGLTGVKDARKYGRWLSTSADVTANLGENSEIFYFSVSKSEDPDSQNIPLHGKFFNVAFGISKQGVNDEVLF